MYASCNMHKYPINIIFKTARFTRTWYKRAMWLIRIKNLKTLSRHYYQPTFRRWNSLIKLYVHTYCRSKDLLYEPFCFNLNNEKFTFFDCKIMKMSDSQYSCKSKKLNQIKDMTKLWTKKFGRILQRWIRKRIKYVFWKVTIMAHNDKVVKKWPGNRDKKEFYGILKGSRANKAKSVGQC